MGTPLDTVLVYSMSMVVPIVIMLFVMGLLLCSPFMGFSSLLPLLMLTICGMAMLVIVPTVIAPLIGLQDGHVFQSAIEPITFTEPFDWAWLGSWLLWAFSWLVTLTIALVVVKLPKWGWAVLVWFCNPPPRWVYRQVYPWLGRPVSRWLARPVVKSYVPAIELPHEDPIFAEIDHAIATADQMLAHEENIVSMDAYRKQKGA